MEQTRDRLTQALKLTEDQLKRLDPILEEMYGQFRGLARIPQEQRRPAAMRIGEEGRQKTRALLTPEQQATFDQMPAGQAGRGGSGGRSWQSVAGVSYFLERSTNLGVSPPFLPLATNLIGQAGTTTFTDANRDPATPAFYRVACQHLERTMNTSPFIAQAAATLLVLIGTGPALLAQNGAIRLSLRGGWASASEPVRKLQVVGSYAYLVVGETGLQVLDVSSPTNPVPLGRYNASQRINGFHVAGQLACLATGDSITPTNDAGVLEVLDVSQPTNLVFLSGTATCARANTVCVAGDAAYVAEGTWWSESNQVGAVEVFSVTNPAHPTVVGRYDASGPVNEVKVVDGYAYLAGGDAALVILDVKDARNPVWIAAPLPPASALTLSYRAAWPSSGAGSG